MADHIKNLLKYHYIDSYGNWLVFYILVRPCGWVTALNVLCCWPFFNVFIYQFHHVLLGVSIKFIIFHVKPVRGIIDTMNQSTHPTLMPGNLWENSAILRSESSRQLG